MTPGRLSLRSEFTPVPSHGSIFVYMIPPQNAMPARVTPVVVPSHNVNAIRNQKVIPV